MLTIVYLQLVFLFLIYFQLELLSAMALTSLPSSNSIIATDTSNPLSNYTQTFNDNEDNKNLTAILTLDQIELNLYRGYSPPFPRYGRVFGGQTVCSCIMYYTVLRCMTQYC